MGSDTYEYDSWDKLIIIKDNLDIEDITMI